MGPRLQNFNLRQYVFLTAIHWTIIEEWPSKTTGFIYIWTVIDWPIIVLYNCIVEIIQYKYKVFCAVKSSIVIFIVELKQ